jgi:Spy/CpxP family protein refolding chaperone
MLLNVAVVCFLLMRSNGRERNEPPFRPDQERGSSILADELELTVQQRHRLDEIQDDFFRKEESLGKVIGAQRDSMNVAMFNQITDTLLVKKIARRTADNEYRMEILRFEQAKQLKRLCTPAQLKKFDRLVLEIRDYFRPNGGPKRK